MLKRIRRIAKKESIKRHDHSLEEWYELMNSCIDVDSERWARDFFDDAETLARELNLVLVDGRKFSADDAVEEWRDVDHIVEKWIDDEELELDGDIPMVGLVYRMHDDRLVLGIHDGVGGFDEMAAWEFTDNDDNVSLHKKITHSQKMEGRNIGAADEYVVDSIDLVVNNEYRLYKQMQALVDNLVKKASKGIDLDKDKLAKSSVVDQLVRDTIRYLQKDDHEGDNEGTFDYISTATRNLAKQYVAETILIKVEDDIRFNQLNNK